MSTALIHSVARALTTSGKGKEKETSRDKTSTEVQVRDPNQMDTSHEIVASSGFVPIEGQGQIEGINRLLIEAPPALEVPEDLRLATVPKPERAWTIMFMGHNHRPYPFDTNAHPTWADFIAQV